jgi:hypothetical protein
MPKRDIEAKKAEAEIMDILGQHITPDWNRLGELMRIAKW